MPLEHAILGFLTYQPLSGYDLKKFFDESVRHFWSTTQSQIYRTLARMAETGWVDMKHIEQDDRPDRKVYHITDTGQDELLKWLTTPLNQSATRNLWLAQVFFSHPLSDEKILALFEQHADMLRQKLDLFHNGVQELVERRFEEIGSKRSRRLWQFTLDYGIAHLEWELQWVENALKDLYHLPSD